MDVTQLSFGIKDVIAISIAVISILGFLYAMKETMVKVTLMSEALNEKMTDLKVDQAKIIAEMKATTNNELKNLHEKVKEKETTLSDKIKNVREEAKESTEKLSSQLLGFGVQLTQINASLSELAGYIKAKTEK